MPAGGLCRPEKALQRKVVGEVFEKQSAVDIAPVRQPSQAFFFGGFSIQLMMNMAGTTQRMPVPKK
jgi:hypothetical protein